MTSFCIGLFHIDKRHYAVGGVDDWVCFNFEALPVLPRSVGYCYALTNKTFVIGKEDFQMSGYQLRHLT